MVQPPALAACYAAWLADLKTRIRETRLRAALAVNSELISLDGQIGREIRERQAAQGWGANDLPPICAICAHSPRRGPIRQFLQRVVGKLPWGQNIELLAVKDQAARLWYAEAALEHGSSCPEATIRERSCPSAADLWCPMMAPWANGTMQARSPIRACGSTERGPAHQFPQLS